MEEFTRELLSLTNKLLSRPPMARKNIHHRGAREEPPPAEPVPGSSAAITQRWRMNQHCHQQQRARRHQHHKTEEALKIQTLYGRYPRKALRKVGEELAYYSGGRDRLEEHVAATYHRAEVSAEDIAEARRHFDNCKRNNWLLQSPPTADDIVQRLRRTVNIFPGIDSVECRHLKP